jgi:hypothetical protein
MLLCLLCLTGCGGKKEEPLPDVTVYPVKCKAEFGGKTIAGISIGLVPTNVTEDKPLVVRGVTAQDGSVPLTTSWKGTVLGQGAPAGEYAVVFTAPPSTAIDPKLPSDDNPEWKGFNSKYSNYGSRKTSPLHVTVKAVPAGETNDIPINVP